MFITNFKYHHIQLNKISNIILKNFILNKLLSLLRMGWLNLIKISYKISS